MSPQDNIESLEFVHAYAPATVANVACAYDVLGFALEEPGDEIIVRPSKSGLIKITQIEGDEGKLPTDPTKNSASVCASAVIDKIKSKGYSLNFGVDIHLIKKLPLGSGLGSSASSSACACMAVNTLFGDLLNKNELIECSLKGEEVACGAAHADNVAPSILGGFVLIRSYNPLDIISIPSPSSLFCSVVTPAVEVRTADARRVLPMYIPLKTAVTQFGNIAGLVAGLTTNNIDLISRSLQDVIIEPLRSKLIPAFDQVKKSAIDAGALGCSISGSGPSIFALSVSKQSAEFLAEVMSNVFTEINISSTKVISKINLTGAKIISKK